MQTPKILILEDEPLAASRLKNLILEILPQAQILTVLDSVESAVTWLRQHHADLIFMDVQLADGLCFEVFKQVDIQQPVIFTTAYDAYAIKAFRIQALDYLLKPLKRAEVNEALNRFRKMHPPIPDLDQVSDIYQGANLPEFRQRYLVRLGTTIRVVETQDIAFIYTESKNTFLMTTEGRRYPVDHSLETIEGQLNPAHFFRANRQYILALHAIGNMHVHSKSRVKVNTVPPAPTQIIVSTEKSAQFKRWLAGQDKPA